MTRCCLNEGGRLISYAFGLTTLVIGNGPNQRSSNFLGCVKCGVIAERRAVDQYEVTSLEWGRGIHVWSVWSCVRLLGVMLETLGREVFDGQSKLASTASLRPSTLLWSKSRGMLGWSLYTR